MTALGAALFYLPSITGNLDTFKAHDLGNVLQVILFFVVGLLTGWLRDRELRQQRLREQESELAAMGAAAACIAHDFKAPLVAIGGFVRLVRKTISDNEAAAAKLDIVIQQTQRLEDMVADILVFARPLKITRRRNSLNTLLSNTALLCAEKAESFNVELRLEYFREESYGDFDFDRLQQALINLIGNAIEACGKTGEVTVRGRHYSNGVLIEVEDTGAGIPAAIKERMFKPFVSGKEKGTGLGLPIVQKIVAAHGGTLTYCSAEHSGTIFTLMLPGVDPAPEKP
ncbi:ATP-binding protein [Desulfofustis glycolicus]|uniref:histidine kinase n=1 Tax=Desulfofustis glycolicus DSM 9705 TaxID=1121409 RepID=A0A1M5XJ61_9BACT|nr:ATP-binding protein [Desulfofustis glycolicus]SHH99851.1 Signal transduction histidine kinase [Desulfofustis glycolicus DSM 9705]